MRGVLLPRCNVARRISHRATASLPQQQGDPTGLSHRPAAARHTSREWGGKKPSTTFCFHALAALQRESLCRGQSCPALPQRAVGQRAPLRSQRLPATRLLWKERLIPTLKKKTLFLSLPGVYMGLKKKKHLLVVLHLAILSVVLKHVSCNK